MGRRLERHWDFLRAQQNQPPRHQRQSHPPLQQRQSRPKQRRLKQPRWWRRRRSRQPRQTAGASTVLWTTNSAAVSVFSFLWNQTNWIFPCMQPSFTAILLVFGHPTRPHLPGELLGTSWLLHGNVHSRTTIQPPKPLREKTHLGRNVSQLFAW